MIALTFPEFVAVWNAARQGQGTPDHLNRMARWLEARWRAGDRQLLLMAFRNSGKSTLAALFAAWLLRLHPDLRLLVLAADLALAQKMVRNTKRVIERHPATRGLKPARPDQWAADRFTIRRPSELRDPSMLARGVSANLTGSRADAVICDDVEVPNTCDTAVKRADLRARLAEIDYVLTPGGLQLYIGTPHTYYSIYADEPRAELEEAAPFLAGFRRLKIPLIGADGRSAWPERFTDGAIARIRRQTGPAKFSSQMQLEPVAASQCRLDPDRLRAYGGELDYRESGGRPVLSLGGVVLVSAACWWDPAFGAGSSAAGGDGSVVAAVFGAADGRSFLHRIQWLNRRDGAAADGDEATRQCRLVARLVGELLVPAVAVETNGLGRFLPGVLRQVLAAEGLAASVIEQASHTPKDRRILEAFDARLAAGSLFAHRSVFATPLIGEMREWRPGQNAGHDDGLDAVAGALSLEPVRLGSGPRPAARPDWRGGATHIAATGFEP
ncbi:MAG: phage terminase large subunit [Rhodospirillaceae bacterium]|nr:phage terminase large subunit [Rhodospirillaceae bacterium]